LPPGVADALIWIMDAAISTLGDCGIKSPLCLKSLSDDLVGNFVPDATRIRFGVEVNSTPELLFEKAGPREMIFFDPTRTRAAIVTCGGLCPGLNNVIRSAFHELFHNYGIQDVLGIRYGYQGLNSAAGLPPMKLTPEIVEDIHMEGGTILGSSRGNQPPAVMTDFLEKNRIDILFCVGGDGTQRGAHAIAEEVRKRGLPIAIVGIPKTIDNDILYVRSTFGFVTAVDRAREVLFCAHSEAHSFPNGIGLVRLMGRDSGFITAMATLASQEVNFTLIPELPFRLDGERGFLKALKDRILNRGHALIAVAEGAGQNLLAGGAEKKDASGNVLHKDIGLFLKDCIAEFFKEEGIPINLKYIDPSYLIRSVPANSEDSLLCDQYARNAVHAAMAGKTDMIIGLWHAFMHVPIALATSARRRVSPESLLWYNVISATGQPARFE
jgi:6-phosphofructokinase 1